MPGVRTGALPIAACAALPLAAQGPLPAPAVKKAEAAAPASKTTVAAASLDPKDLEAWMDGYLPSALERGRIPGAVVVVVRGGEVVLEKGYGYSAVAKRAPVSPQPPICHPGPGSKLLTWTAEERR